MKAFLFCITMALPALVVAQARTPESFDSIKVELNKSYINTGPETKYLFSERAENSLLNPPESLEVRTLYGSRQVRDFGQVVSKKTIYKSWKEKLLELKTLFDAGSITSRQYESLKIKLLGS